MSSFHPIEIIVDDVEVQMVPLANIIDATDGSPASISRIMIDALESDMWPEPLVRNHPTLSASEQIRILKSKVVVVGLGGLGGHLATLMARVGAGHLVLVDGDKYDPSNLNRQILCTNENIGISKADIAAKQCRLINPGLDTTIWTTHFSEENGNQILETVDVVMDGLDQISTRKTLFSLAMSLDIPFVHGAVHGWYGQTATFIPESPSNLDSIYPGDSSQSSPPSVLAPVVATIASLQSQEAIRILIGHTPTNVGKLIYFDGNEMSFHKLSIG